MSLLRHTPVLHDAMQHVAEKKVIAHDPWEPRAEFSWAKGGEMTAAEVEALSTLLHAHLIVITEFEERDARRVRDKRLHAVKLTFDGVDRLNAWNRCEHGERVA